MGVGVRIRSPFPKSDTPYPYPSLTLERVFGPKMESERLVPITIESAVKFYIDIGGRTFYQGPIKSVLFFQLFWRIRSIWTQAPGATHVQRQWPGRT